VKVPSVPARDDREPDSQGQSGSAPAEARGGPIRYLARLWRGEVRLGQVFWRDMVVIGTVVNLVAIGLAFLAVAFGASTATGIAIFLAPVPYNILLVAAVWRRAAVESSEWAWGARIGALLWFLLALLL
jgi:hypothetical protein